jgi:hypothetical protein
MFKLIALTLTLCLSYCSKSDKDIHKDRTEYCYVSSDSLEYRVITYEIKNESKEPYITFLYYKPVRNSSQAIWRFFVQPIGEFNLLSMLTDNVVIREDPQTVIETNFMKIINPNESFKYIIHIPSNIDGDIGKYIYIEKKSVAEQMLMVTIPDFISYIPQQIVITDIPHQY